MWTTCEQVMGNCEPVEETRFFSLDPLVFSTGFIFSN